MSRARRSLSSTASSLPSEKLKPDHGLPDTITGKAENASTDLEDGEIADEADFEEAQAVDDMGEVVVKRDSSSERDGSLDEDQSSESLGREYKDDLVPKPSTPETLKSFDGSEEHSGTDSSLHQIPTSSTPASNSTSDGPFANSSSPCALSEEELEIAKDVVLDLLGWGVQPEYLIECGISSHAIYRIFTDLHLRLPANLSYLGPG